MNVEKVLAINRDMQYCNSLTTYSRFKTREVCIGDIPLGAKHPIRIQSMTTTDSMDVLATVEQTIRLAEAGCDYVRITAQSIKEAHSLENIKKELAARGYAVPLIADIHYTSNAAELAARMVEKVRINPGNYADKKKFKIREYSDQEYKNELERIRERFIPLVKICKEYGTAIRIGTNHGSLSDRIMNRYGDTPLGMVESALEFVKICEDMGYYDIVLSMKASNPRVMVQAYRLLISRMLETQRNYPIHLGVTEAGAGEDGKIKSAVGIGTLLEDGIGDTVRVSLTGQPETEVPVAKELVARYKKREAHQSIKPAEKILNDPFQYQRRKTIAVGGIGGDNVPKVIIDITKDAGQPVPTSDFVYLGNKKNSYDLPDTVNKIYDAPFWKSIKDKDLAFPLFKNFQEYHLSDNRSQILNFIQLSCKDIFHEAVSKSLLTELSLVIVLTTDSRHGMADQRNAFFKLLEKGIKAPVIIKRAYKELNEDQLKLYAATDLGALLIDGLGDGTWIDAQHVTRDALNRINLGILQAAGTRISKTEYVACPSCGRTLFDLEKVVKKIQNKTSHLKKIKIGIMGCIVNGPGEMADADYGYVGSGYGKITLYKGKAIVKKNVDEAIAVDELVALIKEDGQWINPILEDD